MKQLERDERKIRFIEANMKFEGFQLTENTKAACKRILRKEVSGDEVVRSCILKCKKGAL
jgi:hypothetical protein